MKFGYKKQVNLSFDEAEKKAREELVKEGFGIITEINARETFKKKLDVDFENYIILGACHPASAHEVLQVDRELGLLLPCNVIVYENEGNVYVSSILPSVAMRISDNTDLDSIASNIQEKLIKVVDSI